MERGEKEEEERGKKSGKVTRGRGCVGKLDGRKTKGQNRVKNGKGEKGWRNVEEGRV